MTLKRGAHVTVVGKTPLRDHTGVVIEARNDPRAGRGYLVRLHDAGQKVFVPDAQLVASRDRTNLTLVRQIVVGVVMVLAASAILMALS